MNKIEIYKSILDKDNENANIWYLLGEEYILQNNLSEALFSFANALKQEDSKVKNSVYHSLKCFLSDQFIEDSSLPIQQIEDVDHIVPKQPIHLELIKSPSKDNVISLEDRVPKRITFDDVGGLESLKRTIEMKIIKPFLNPSLFSKFRKKAGGGILLYGPPGCGKTFIAKATAGECSANFYPVHIAEILDPYIGVSEQNLHDVFETARANSPSVLFFDELDALGYSRAKSRSDVLRPLVDTMLTELQSVDTNTDKLLVIGATNMPWDVDAAFKRPGRFDKLVFVPPPDKIGRKIIFELKLQGKPVEGDINLDLLAEKTVNYSGADIENVVEIATETVLDEIMETNNVRNISMEDLLAAINSTKPSTVEWLNTIKNYIKYSNQSGLYNDAADYIKDHL
ncbi:MAG: ATPase [Bacillales bacterium]|jgi:SpoVK/Ycf46/Vps4 family AAA+-type ATPase|nr:ATPase [Bacillales bacterium]